MRVEEQMLILLSKAAASGLDDKVRSQFHGLWNQDEFDVILMLNLAKKHNVLYAVINCFFELCKMNGITLENGLDTQLKNIALKNYVTQNNRWLSTQKLLKSLNDKNIQYLLFKGYIIAGLYERYDMRPSSDLDIFAEKTEWNAMNTIFNELGYKIDTCKTTDNVRAYISNGNGHAVELHCSLWEDLYGTRIDILNDLMVTAEDKVRTVLFDGTPIRTMGATEHLVYSMFHTIKHYCFDGALWQFALDTTLYINTYYETIIWDRFYSMIEQAGFSTFTDAFLYMCTEELGMRPVPHNKAEYKGLAEYILNDTFSIHDTAVAMHTRGFTVGDMNPFFSNVFKPEIEHANNEPLLRNRLEFMNNIGFWRQREE